MKKLLITDVDTAKYAYASFCFGRGWRGHNTEDAAIRSACRDARAMVRRHGGGLPQHAACRADGTLIMGLWV